MESAAIPLSRHNKEEINFSAFSALLHLCMKTKDTSTIATALSWIEEPDFIESSERLADSLISSFPISRVEALTIVIIEAMCNHNVIATKKKTREALSDQFGIILTKADMKSVEKMFDIIAGGRTRLNSLSTPWVAYLWKNAALSNFKPIFILLFCKHLFL